MNRLFCSSFQNREKKTVGFYKEKNLKMGVHEGYFSLQKKYQSVQNMINIHAKKTEALVLKQGGCMQ